ncbi:MAG: RNA 2',3'-cyclic phosphodiesterase [Clostridia bacterium]|nr:RNA 2',3'-cyclic phosphodiesterase [Clostridia bacterium]
MRLFIAVNFSAEAKNELKRQIDHLKADSRSGNFTREGNLHLTLAFIGEYSDIEAVKRALDGITAKEFEIKLKGSGNFGSLYWIGIEKEPALFELAGALRAGLEKEGIPFDKKPFSPHITVAREVTTDTKIILKPESKKSRIDKISLMRSDRVNGKLTYTEIYEKRF